VQELSRARQISDSLTAFRRPLSANAAACGRLGHGRKVPPAMTGKCVLQDSKVVASSVSFREAACLQAGSSVFSALAASEPRPLN
jgi:hypothetical protein